MFSQVSELQAFVRVFYLEASGLGGGTRKQTDGTVAMFPAELMTRHLLRWAFSSSTHSSFLWIEICEGRLSSSYDSKNEE